MIEIRLCTGQAVRFQGDCARLQELFPQVKQARLQNEWILVEDSNGHPACYFPANSVAYMGVVTNLPANTVPTHSLVRVVPGDGSKN